MSDIEEFVIQNFEAAYEAFRTGNISRLDELAKGSPFPCGTDGWLGRRWLTNAIDSHNPDAVAWVLSKNPQVNYVDEDGFTALKSILQVENDSKIVEKLNDKDAASLTIKLIDMLLKAGAEINLTATLAETVLHTAAMWSSPSVVQHLLLCGADPLAWDDEYSPRQPADYAKLHKRWEVHAILRDAMKQDPSGRSKDMDTIDR
ncbi:ankyrin repeat domain-containing protein [Arenibacterium sp. CAU 1754]